MKPDTRSVCIAMLCGASAAVAQANPPDSITPAEQLLFMTDHLQAVPAAAVDLVYRFDKHGSLAPAGSQEVHVRLSHGGKGLGAVVSDASGATPLAVDAPLQGNPVILYFLEKDIAGMRQLTGGQPRYFQKRIRLALAQGPAITPVTEQFDGKPVPARQIMIQPYLDDPRLVSRHRSDVVGCAQPSERSARRVAQPIPSVLASDATQRCDSRASADRQMTGDATLARLAGKRYTFVLSDSVPGQVLLLKSEVPRQRPDAQPRQAPDFSDPVQTETLRFGGAQP